MAAETCINHPTKVAVARCKTCHRPLCNECKLITDIGIFCSEQCHDRAKAFSERVESLPLPRRRTFGRLFSFIKKLFFLAILVAIAYGVITFIYGTPEKFLEQIMKLVRLITR